MTRKQANILRSLKTTENKAWTAYTRSQPSIAEALEIFGKDDLYAAWLLAAAKAADFKLTCLFGTH
jgi:hypothetical protein